MAQTAKMIMYIYTYFPPSLVVRNAALSHQAAPQRISLWTAVQSAHRPTRRGGCQEYRRAPNGDVPQVPPGGQKRETKWEKMSTYIEKAW